MVRSISTYGLDYSEFVFFFFFLPILIFSIFFCLFRFISNKLPQTLLLYLFIPNLELLLLFFGQRSFFANAFMNLLCVSYKHIKFNFIFMSECINNILINMTLRMNLLAQQVLIPDSMSWTSATSLLSSFFINLTLHEGYVHPNFFLNPILTFVKKKSAMYIT